MILVTGVSGVGKTHTIQAFMSSSDSYKYVRASQVLTDLGRPTRNLTQLDVAENQKVLRREIAFMAEAFGDKLLVDGHACIETNDGRVVP